jgi:sugar fermentation stimulation protein A
VDIIGPELEKNVRVHVHDPGRLKELLYPGNEVLLRKASTAGRKTEWDLVAAKSVGDWVLVHTGFHRGLAETILRSPGISPLGEMEEIVPEVKRNGSRLDFLLRGKDGRETWLEVKGCTLVVDSVALFPDAPTERGLRHVRELIELAKSGENASLLILVFLKSAECFRPNVDTDPAFSDAFYEALNQGVGIHPVILGYREGHIRYEGEIPVCCSE